MRLGQQGWGWLLLEELLLLVGMVVGQSQVPESRGVQP